MWWFVFALGCGDADDGSPVGAPPAVPAQATGLGDLVAVSGVDELDTSQLVPSLHGFSLYASSGRIRGKVRGELLNNTDHVLVDGELEFKFTVTFEDGCPREIRGTKSLSSLGVSERKPWRPGESVPFTISSDEHLPEITGEFAAERVELELFAFVEDPICWRARGVVATAPANWQAATVGAPASGAGLTNRRVQLNSAPDGGSRMETIDDAMSLTVVQAKGDRLLVQTPGGTQGWMSADHLDLHDAGAMF